MIDKVQEYLRLSDRIDDLEFEQFAADTLDDAHLIEDEIFELETRRAWLYDEMTLEERDELEKLL